MRKEKEKNEIVKIDENDCEKKSLLLVCLLVIKMKNICKFEKKKKKLELVNEFDNENA